MGHGSALSSSKIGVNLVSFRPDAIKLSESVFGRFEMSSNFLQFSSLSRFLRSSPLMSAWHVLLLLWVSARDNCHNPPPPVDAYLCRKPTMGGYVDTILSQNQWSFLSPITLQGSNSSNFRRRKEIIGNPQASNDTVDFSSKCTTTEKGRLRQSSTPQTELPKHTPSSLCFWDDIISSCRTGIISPKIFASLPINPGWVIGGRK